MAKKRKNKYNHYTEDFRREAVRRSEDPNVSAADAVNAAEKRGWTAQNTHRHKAKRYAYRYE